MGICDETCEFFGTEDDMRTVPIVSAVKWNPELYTYCRKPGEECVILRGREYACYVKKASLLFDK